MGVSSLKHTEDSLSACTRVRACVCVGAAVILITYKGTFVVIQSCTFPWLLNCLSSTSDSKLSNWCSEAVSVLSVDL